MPDDGLSQSLEIKNQTMSLLANENKQKSTNHAISTRTSHYREIHFSISNLVVKDVLGVSERPIYVVVGDFIDTFIFQNVIFQNSTCPTVFSLFTFFKSIKIENIKFLNISENPGTILMMRMHLNTQISNLIVDSYTISTQTTRSPIRFRYNKFASFSMNNITVMNSKIYSNPVFKFESSVGSVEVTNGYYFNNSLFPNSAFYTFSELKTFHLTNHTIDQVSDEKDDNSNFITISYLDLANSDRSEIKDISFTNSSISFGKVLDIMGSSTEMKNLSLTNLEFKDSLILSSRSLISFEGLTSSTSFNIIIDEILFHNIVFKTSGNLINFMHQLPSFITIKNSSFRNISSGLINVETYNTNNNDLVTKAKIYN